MDSVQDILMHAVAGDRDNFRTTINDILMSKAAEAVDLMRNDVAASMFSATTGEEDYVQDEVEQQEQPDSTEDSTNEDI